MTQVSLYCWAVRGSKWEENLFLCRIGRCCSNEIPERSGHKGEWCGNIRIMTSRKSCCRKNIMVLVKDKYMFSIVEYRILILFDRLFILGNVTEPCFCLSMSCFSSLQWVFPLHPVSVLLWPCTVQLLTLKCHFSTVTESESAVL